MMNANRETDIELMAAHRNDLRASGLTNDTIQQARLYTEFDVGRIAELLGRKKKAVNCLGPCLVIPYFATSGDLSGYKRVKPLYPRVQADGRYIKYESPTGGRNHAYIPPDTASHVLETRTPLIVTEGEKKSLKSTQEGFPAIGLPGVWNFRQKDSTKLPAEMEVIDWQSRMVFVVFDSDAVRNPSVAKAEKVLALELAKRGATVHILRLPEGPDGEDGKPAKAGLDDYLVAHGNVAFRKLLDAAEAIDVAEVQAECAGIDRVASHAADPMILARIFINTLCRAHGELALRFWRDEFWAWRKGCYVIYPDSELRARVTSFIDQFVYKITRGLVTNILECLKAEVVVTSLIKQPIWLDGVQGSEKCIATANGILDIRDLLNDEGKPLRPHSPAWFSPVQLPYAFDPSADCPLWKDVIEHNLAGDEQRIMLLQEWFGYLLTLDTTQQKFVVLIGEGSNGKSVAIAAMMAMLGVENCSSIPLEMFGVRFQMNATLGKLANFAADAGEIDKIAEGHLKSFTSGDRMAFERKFHDPLQAVPTARFVLATNNFPRFGDKSDGLWRRMIVIPFDVQIPDERKIKGMDRAEWWEHEGQLPGILNWAIQGLRRLRQQNGFTESNVCRKALHEHRLDNNPALQFLQEEYCKCDARVWTATAAIYQEYRRFCNDNGFRLLPRGQFGKQIAKAFPTAERKQQRREWGYYGICAGDGAS